MGLPDIDDKLQYIHGIIPCHVDKLPHDACHQLTKSKEKWESIIPAPPWLATLVQKSSSPISDVPARMSYKVASSFTLPDNIESSAPVQKKQLSTPWKGSKVVQFMSQTDTSEPPQTSALLSSGTPFKSAKGIFAQGKGNNLGPFPSAGPNRHISASNFLYGTDDIPVFPQMECNFLGFHTLRMQTPHLQILQLDLVLPLLGVQFQGLCDLFTLCSLKIARRQRPHKIKVLSKRGLRLLHPTQSLEVLVMLDGQMM